ncbi:flagellar basal body-associated FliL family protein [Luteithermobacter gelatinilyticus]|uniref:flagellar basal body-associated FliL family protein n=1 Tax=Luteithermobacter gelatinilyticus TaxID=2582913 RepID=UPI001105F672|nr:flagellar basal body-associated FliL family protein [Luteithermobacter gelatinilyticus]
MSDEINDEDLAEGLERKKISGKKIVLFIVLPALLLLGGGSLALMLLGGEDGNDAAAGEEQAALAAAKANEPTELLFLDLDPMLVNLNTAGGKPSYLKLTISLEVDKQSSLEDLQQKLPRIIDNFQVYLRELRVEDLNGSAGMFRLKEELLIRVNEAVYPTRVHDVLFKEILING